MVIEICEYTKNTELYTLKASYMNYLNKFAKGNYKIINECQSHNNLAKSTQFKVKES